ncbi:MAG TPA: hypothetical protein P5071_03910 [Paludibacteraceae bacterium]|nr:hypothetical protein [Paludibacteraceae bacterium]HOL00122.1 hypothetical protein [Paludibacteraceae bacterium]HPC26232.1 hypothetical protein [Paludibacteraceae bacterium]HPO67046.1 hypothetical protein [Paludibacteraceae bacterium]HRR62967.1 hypothetical protein [Paludibacteraceae bacterium]
MEIIFVPLLEPLASETIYGACIAIELKMMIKEHRKSFPSFNSERNYQRNYF